MLTLYTLYIKEGDTWLSLFSPLLLQALQYIFHWLVMQKHINVNHVHRAFSVLHRIVKPTWCHDWVSVLWPLQLAEIAQYWNVTEGESWICPCWMDKQIWVMSVCASVSMLCVRVALHLVFTNMSPALLVTYGILKNQKWSILYCKLWIMT